MIKMQFLLDFTTCHAAAGEERPDQDHKCKRLHHSKYRLAKVRQWWHFFAHNQQMTKWTCFFSGTCGTTCQVFGGCNVLMTHLRSLLRFVWKILILNSLSSNYDDNIPKYILNIVIITCLNIAALFTLLGPCREGERVEDILGEIHFL